MFQVFPFYIPSHLPTFQPIDLKFPKKKHIPPLKSNELIPKIAMLEREIHFPNHHFHIFSYIISYIFMISGVYIFIIFHTGTKKTEKNKVAWSQPTGLPAPSSHPPDASAEFFWPPQTWQQTTWRKKNHRWLSFIGLLRGGFQAEGVP